MTKEELLKKIQYYKIKVDKSTKEFIKTRLVEISHRVDDNGYFIYNLKELTPYGKRAYQGSKVFYAYKAVIEAITSAKERGNELRAEARDMKANPGAYASDEDLMQIFNTLGKTTLAKQA